MLKKVKTKLPNKGKQIKTNIVDVSVSNNKYNPSQSKYHPVNDATWKYGEK